MPTNTTDIEKRLWDAADELRANSKLKASEYSVPVLGLIFLKFADVRFTRAQDELKQESSGQEMDALEYQARGVMYVPDAARFSYLLQLPEGQDRGKAINDAMRAIEAENPRLKEVLPKTYNRLDNRLLTELLRTFDAIPMDVEGDLFGKIYEYFLGKFAMSEGQKGGEFFTPTSLVKLIVEVIEPFSGRIYDPACGSGGMFVQSARFVEQHKGKPFETISIYGQEKTSETIRLAQMNLAVHGLEGDIRQGNSYYDDPFHSSGKFDFVMANPPFNVDKVQKETLKDDKARFPFGMPNGKANYLWIQLFYSALNNGGRAGFVMANSASDARSSELAIRQQLVQTGAVDVVIAIAPNFFYTVILACTLWFFDRGKRGTPREDAVLFIDARQMFRQIDRAHREFKSGDVSKQEIADRFPLLQGSAEILVESPIDSKQWDWDEALDEETLRQKLSASVAPLRQRATAAVEELYAAERYQKTATELAQGLPYETQKTVLALTRSASLGTIENLELVTPEPDPGEMKAVTREFGRFKKLWGTISTAVSPEMRTQFLDDQTIEYDDAAQSHILEIFRDSGLLLDKERTKLRFDADYIAPLINAMYEEDCERVIELWRKTRHTNHLKILRDIVRAYRGEEGAPPYVDVAGLCKVATRQQIEGQGWSLNPGRYVGVAAHADNEFDLRERLEEWNEELERLNTEAHELEEKISDGITSLLER